MILNEQKIHLHCPLWANAWPTNGPRAEATAHTLYIYIYFTGNGHQMDLQLTFLSAHYKHLFLSEILDRNNYGTEGKYCSPPIP